jgi:peptidoglycan hydrolase CwlO-like protein
VEDLDITRVAVEPLGSETPNARAELICTLVRELVADSVSTDRLQARDEEITSLKAELTTVTREVKSLRAQLKKIRNLLGDGV